MYCYASEWNDNLIEDPDVDADLLTLAHLRATLILCQYPKREEQQFLQDTTMRSLSLS